MADWGNTLTQSRGHPKRPGHHCQCQVGLLPIPCQRQLVLQALELFSACVSDIPPWCIKVNSSTTMQWNLISSLVLLVHSLLVSSYVLVVVVCWWWRRGGVWREGCHWLHIHVPPSLVPTILLHHPGHQIILHQAILCTKRHCTKSYSIKPQCTTQAGHQTTRVSSH